MSDVSTPSVRIERKVSARTSSPRRASSRRAGAASVTTSASSAVGTTVLSTVTSCPGMRPRSSWECRESFPGSLRQRQRSRRSKSGKRSSGEGRETSQGYLRQRQRSRRRSESGKRKSIEKKVSQRNRSENRNYNVRRRSRSRSPWVSVQSRRLRSKGRTSIGARDLQVRQQSSRAVSEPRVKLGQKHMCPLFDVASSILRAWSQDRERSRGNTRYNPKHRECLAVNQYCDRAVKSKEVNMDKGKVVPYVEGAYQSLLECKSPSGVKAWHKGQRSKLSEQKESGRKEYKSWVKGIKDNKVQQVSEKIQAPLMLKLSLIHI